MSIKASASSLGQCVQDLMVSWNQTRSSWRDAKSLEFERTYLEKLPDHISRANSMIEELDMLLRKVRTDCE